MRLLWVSARKDLRLRLRDPMSLLLWMGIPVVLGLLISLVTGGGDGGKPSGTLLIANQDDAFAATLVGSLFSQGPMGEIFEVDEVSVEEGRERMEAGGASALIVVPEGFLDGLLLDEPVTLELVKNPSQTILPGMVEEVLSLLADAVFYIQELFGEQLKVFGAGPPEDDVTFPNAFIAAFSVDINDLNRRVQRYLDPVLIELKTRIADEEEGEEPFNFMMAFLPGMIFMGLLFLAQGMSEDIWKEHQGGTLRRALTTPAGSGAFLGGKMAAGALLLLVILIVGVGAGRFLVGFHAQNVPLALAWGTAFGLVFYLLMTFIQAFAGSARTGSILSSVVVFPLLMLGGSFFPFEAMPSGMAAIGRLTPNGWALAHFRAITTGDSSGAAVAAGFGLMLLAAAGLFLLLQRRLRVRFGGA